MSPSGSTTRIKCGVVLFAVSTLAIVKGQTTWNTFGELALSVASAALLLGWPPAAVFALASIVSRQFHDARLWLFVAAAGALLIAQPFWSSLRHGEKLAAESGHRVFHAVSWRRYHTIFLASAIGWAVVAVLTPSLKTSGIAAAVIGSFYAVVLYPTNALNADTVDHLRRPRLPKICAGLSMHVPVNYLANSVLTAAMTRAVTDVFGFSFVILGVVLPIVAITGYFLLTPGFFAVVKLVAAGPTRIAVFRRFDTSTAVLHRSRVLPILGSYGYVVTYSDTALKESDSGYFWESQDTLGGTFNHLVVGDSNWQRHVAAELQVADYACFDWTTEPTSSMMFEFITALRLLPPSRLIWLVPAERRDAVSQWITAHPSWTSGTPLVVARDSGYRALAVSVYRVFANSTRELRLTARASEL